MGLVVGEVVGEVVGDVVGDTVGDTVGDVVGDAVVGDVVGETVGEVVGQSLLINVESYGLSEDKQSVGSWSNCIRSSPQQYWYAFSTAFGTVPHNSSLLLIALHSSPRRHRYHQYSGRVYGCSRPLGSPTP